MSSRKHTLIGVLIILTTVIVLQLVNGLEALPSGAESVTPGAVTVFNGSFYNPDSTTAEAGNITYLSINSIGPTRFWQGYYGNITAEIVLEDANGYRLYNWSALEPNGEIYASRFSTIDWSNVTCMNDSTTNMTFSIEELFHDIDPVDEDGIVDTFVYNDHPELWIGNRNLNGCNTTWTFVNDESQNARFPMAILESEVDNASIYVTWLENRDNGNITDVPGFDNLEHDFQFMVPENGTNNNVVPTTYYFWVNLG